MLRFRLVKDSRIIQISGKMLIASRRAIVGATNSHAMVRSDRPRVRKARRDSVCEWMRLIASSSGWVIVVIALPGVLGSPDHRPGEEVAVVALGSCCIIRQQPACPAHQIPWTNP